MADTESDSANGPPNEGQNIELIDEEDILGMTEGSQEEGDDMDDERSKKIKRKQEFEDLETEETGQRKLRKTTKQDYKKLATGKGKGPKNNSRKKKGATPAAEATTSDREDEATGGKSPNDEATGGKSPNDDRDKTPIKQIGGKTPNEQAGGKTPNEQEGGKTPNEQDEETPNEDQDDTDYQGGKTPIRKKGGKSPRDGSSSPESVHDSESETTEAEGSTAENYLRERNELQELTEDLKRKLSEKKKEAEKSKKEAETNKKNLRLRTKETEEAEKENRKLRKEIDEVVKENKRLRKETEEAEKENRKLRKEMEETKKAINTLKRQNEDQEDLCNMEMRAKEQNKEEIRKLREKLKEEERENEKLRNVKEEIKRDKSEIQEQLNDTRKQLTNTKKKLEEAENMNEELIQKITSNQQKSPTTSKEYQEKTKKTRALLIGDSNAKRIKQILQDDTLWFLTENTYRIEDISKVSGINEFDCCVTLLGTNNLKTGNDGIQEAKNLMAALQKYVKIPKIICEAPPINRRAAKTERKLFNATLLKQRDQMKHTTILRMPKETESSPVEETLSDDLHLNHYHATLLANKISATVREIKPTKPHEEEKQETELVLEALEEEIKVVIGSGHSKAAELESEYNVLIKATRKNPNKITILGNKDQAQQVHDILKRKIRDHKERRERNIEQKETRRKTPCIFYAQKRCIKGEKCQYLHDRRRPSRERGPRGRSRSPSAGPSDTRTVRIRPRDHE